MACMPDVGATRAADAGGATQHATVGSDSVTTIVESSGTAPGSAPKHMHTHTARDTDSLTHTDTLSDEIDIHAPEYDAAIHGPLLLPGRKFPLDFSGGEFRVHEVPILISERPDASAGTGLNVWDGAVVLAKYLERHAEELVAGRTVLELGSGTGLVAVVASVLGAARVVATDLEYALHNTRNNVRLNALNLHGKLEVTELDWFRPSACSASVLRADVILGADVVWVPELIPALVDTLDYLTSQPNASGKFPDIYISHQTRAHRSDRIFLDGLAAKGLIVRTVPRSQHHPRYVDPDIMIFHISRDTAESAS